MRRWHVSWHRKKEMKNTIIIQKGTLWSNVHQSMSKVEGVWSHRKQLRKITVKVTVRKIVFWYMSFFQSEENDLMEREAKIN